MPISPADLRDMLRADAVALVLGGLLVLTGLFTVALVGILRRRAVLLLWLGAFSLLYGIRLLVRSGAFHLFFDLSPAFWAYADAALTYTVPIPLVLFARLALPAWRRFWTRGALLLTAFAIYGVASDALLEQPYSVDMANSAIAIAFFVGILFWCFRPVTTISRDLHTARIGVLAVSLAAVADNLRGIGVLAFPRPDLEPFGFTVLIACLGTIAVRRVLADAQRLVVIDRELSIARQIQSSILPQAMPQIPGMTIVARYRPMTAVAGDFYDFLELDGHRIGILVADVSGHGVPAALIASMVKVAFAAQRGHADSPAAVLSGMNDTLCGRLAGQYVTAAYLFIDIPSRMIRYAAAGHPPMLRSARRDGTVNEVEQNGLLLGFLEGTNYRELQQSLRGDDRFLLYTDGLIEATNTADDFFGLERCKAALASTAGRQTHEVIDHLLAALDTWSRQPPGDDLTVVLVDWTSER